MAESAAHSGIGELTLKSLGLEGAANPLQEETERLYIEAREDVYRYLLTLGLHPPQAQDTTQEIFLRLYVALKKGEAIRNTRAWVFRVAHNLGLNVRARQESGLPFEPEMECSIPAPGRNPEQALIEREKMARLRNAVANLSEQQKICLFLRAEGLRYQEIAEVLGVGTSTVGEFLRRAITRLRRASSD
ncbi:MAG TPA: sigma-70 family RNA polymerase sigma factor [Bryobacteraceae bacterium]|nr:sigma-70 family RNA polymerase sigma factor [Bryobacteraceae bacterium]HOL71831.1 sigma-70 family RNA polymerase sigma factor [Bryobacteraceae bacterium]HOQ45541.1 sigma-70 family RNA polymerase sigma factor [Bryobacteraceae bacterium]HPQ16841.1 sigma-70 family RNA polymerase sigma factor [Bryobacteraceae bacterium]HPU73421.1 sigma-70 family RNA polymerase sigma factor [Bryobacteraceae bacterium]